MGNGVRCGSRVARANRGEYHVLGPSTSLGMGNSNATSYFPDAKPLGAEDLSFYRKSRGGHHSRRDDRILRLMMSFFTGPT